MKDVGSEVESFSLPVK
jgi:hypothetical protein